MRVIEFRGKCLKTDGWAYGMPLESQFDCTYMITRQGGMKADFIYSRYTIKDYEDRIAVATETVGQYTGLKDKNDTKIYEGDICQIRTSRKHGHVADDELVILGSVEFGRITIADNSIYTFNAFHIKGRSIEYELTHKLEVIGNIYENPELLNQEI